MARLFLLALLLVSTTVYGEPIERWVACTIQNHWGGGTNTQIEAIEECYAVSLAAGNVSINGTIGPPSLLHKGAGISVSQAWSLTHLASQPPQDFTVTVHAYCGPGAATPGNGQCRCDWQQGLHDYFWNGSHCVNTPCPSGAIRDSTTGMCLPASGCPIGTNCKSTGLASCTLPATNNPVSIGSGNKFLAESDLTEPLLDFHRTYNGELATADFRRMIERSSDDDAGVGHGWLHSFERRILVPNRGTNQVWAIRPMGRQLRFTSVAGRWSPDADIPGRLEELFDTAGSRSGWAYSDVGSQAVEYYDADGLLQSISSGGGEVVLTYADGTYGNGGGAAGLSHSDIITTIPSLRKSRSHSARYATIL